MKQTMNFASLAGVEELRRLMQALALLDAILVDEWELRYYSFNGGWSDTEQMGSVRNGCGDDLFAVFDDAGCFLRGSDHEALMSPWARQPQGVWPGVLEGVPREFSNSLNEPAFHMEDTTFCIWRHSQDPTWSHGPIRFPEGEDPDGSEWMLALLDGRPESYQAYAMEYLELEVPLGAINRVFGHEPLSLDLLRAFPTSRSLSDVMMDAQEIGYPLS